MYNIWDIQEGEIIIYVDGIKVGAIQEIYFGEEHSATVYRAVIDLNIIPEPFKRSVSSNPQAQLIPFDIIYKGKEKLINCWFNSPKADLFKADNFAIFNKVEIYWDDYIDTSIE